MATGWRRWGSFVFVLLSASASAQSVDYYFNQPVDHRVALPGVEALGDIDLGQIAVDELSRASGEIFLTGYEASEKNIIDAFIQAHQSKHLPATAILDSDYLKLYEKMTTAEQIRRANRGERYLADEEFERVDVNRDGKVDEKEIASFNVRQRRAMEAADRMRAAGINVVTNEFFKGQRNKVSTGLNHEKILLITGTNTVLIASGNWTQTDLYGDLDDHGRLISQGNHNSLVRIRSREVVEWMLPWMRLLAAGRFGQSLPSESRKEFVINGEKIEILISSPGVNIPNIMAERIRAMGNERIRIASFWLNHLGIESAIYDQLKKYPNLRVEVVLDWGSAGDPRSSYERFVKMAREFGSDRLDVRVFTQSPKDPYLGYRDKFHHKFIILEGKVDGKSQSEVIDGSANLTGAGGTSNTEISIRSLSRRAVNVYNQRFESILSLVHSSPGPLADRIYPAKRKLGESNSNPILGEKKSPQPPKPLVRETLSGNEAVNLRIGFVGDRHGTIFGRNVLGSDGKGEMTGGLGELITLRNQLPFDLFFDLGDMDEGGARETSLDQGRHINALWSKYARVTARTLGNHDFQFGPEQFIEREQMFAKAGVPLVCANVKGIPWMKEALELEVKGLRVVVTGVLPEQYSDLPLLKSYSETIRQRNDIPVTRERFSFEDPYKAVHRVVEEYRGKADVFILLAHLGSTPRYHHNVINLAKEIRGGVSLILDGHDHIAYEKPIVVNGIPIAKAGAMGTYLGDVTLTVSRRPRSNAEVIAYEGKLHRIEAGMKVEPTLAKEVDQYRSELEEKYDLFRPVAKLQVAAVADREFTDQLRGKVNLTNLADLVAAAILENQQAGRNVDIALINGGGIRNSIPAGIVTRKDLLEVRPASSEYPDYPILSLTGEELDAAFAKVFSSDPLTRFALRSPLSVVSEEDGEGKTSLHLRFRGESLPKQHVFRVATSGYIAAQILRHPSYLKREVPLIDGEVALENYVERIAPIPEIPAFPKPVEKVVTAERSKIPTTEILLWDYQRKSRESVLEGYLILSDELLRYASNALREMDGARDHYVERHAEARKVTKPLLKRSVDKAVKRGEDPLQSVDAYDIKKFSKVLKLIGLQKANLIRSVERLRVKIAEQGSRLQDPASCPHLSRCVDDLNQMRRELDQLLPQLNLKRWEWRDQRMKIAGDLRAGDHYEADPKFTESVGRSKTNFYYDSIIQRIPSPEVREAAYFLISRQPRYAWQMPPSSSGDFHDPDQKKLGGNAEHVARAAIDLMEKQRTSEHRGRLLQEIVSDPYLRSMAEVRGVESTLQALRSYEILGIFLHDEFKNGWVSHQLDVPSSRNAYGEHTRWVNTIAGYPVDPPFPQVGYGTSHEALPPVMIRQYLKSDLKGKLDPYLTEKMMTAMIHHAGPWSPGEAGALYPGIKDTATNHIHISDGSEAMMMAEKVEINGKLFPIFRGKQHPSVFVRPKYDSVKNEIYWENEVSKDRYDKAFIEERYRANDLTEVRGESVELETSQGIQSASTYRLYSVNQHNWRAAKPLYVPTESGDYIDTVNPHAGMIDGDNLPYGRPIYKNQSWSEAHQRYMPNYRFLLPEKAGPDGTGGDFTKWEPSVPADPGSNEYQPEIPKREWVIREFSEALHQIRDPRLREVAQRALEIAPHYLEFIPALPTDSYLKEMGLRGVGGMVLRIQRTAKELERLLESEKSLPIDQQAANGLSREHLADLARVGVLLLHSTEHGWVNRQYDMPSSTDDPFRATFGDARLGWPNPSYIWLISPEGKAFFTSATRARIVRERLEARYGKNEVRPIYGSRFILGKMYQSLVAENKISQPEYSLLVQALQIANDAETNQKKFPENIPGAEIDPASALADLLVRAESNWRKRDMRTKRLVLPSGEAKDVPYYEGFARNLIIEPFKSSDGRIKYRNQFSGEVYERSQVASGTISVNVRGATKTLLKTLGDGNGKPIAMEIDGNFYPVYFVQGKPTLFEPILNQGEVRYRNVNLNHDPLYDEKVREGWWQVPKVEYESLGFFVTANGTRAYALTEARAKQLARESADTKATIEPAGNPEAVEEVIQPEKLKTKYGKQLEFLLRAEELRKEDLRDRIESRVKEFTQATHQIRDSRPAPKSSVESDSMPPTSPQPTLISSPVSSRMKFTKDFSASAGMFAGQKFLSDVVVVGSEAIWEAYRDWKSFEDLRRAFAQRGVPWLKEEAKVSTLDAVEMGVAGGMGETVMKGLAPTSMLTQRVGALWIALALVDVRRKGHVTMQTTLLGVPNVLLAHYAAEKSVLGVRDAIRAIRAARAARQGIEALRIGVRSMETESLASMNWQTMLATGVVEFTLLHGMSVLEHRWFEPMEQTALREDVVKKYIAFQRVSFSDRVLEPQKYGTKREEWGASFEAFVGSLKAYMYHTYEEARSEYERETVRLEKRARGGWWIGPLSATERAAETYRIETAYVNKLNAMEKKLTEHQRRAKEMPVPLPEGQDGQKYEASVAATFEEYLAPHPQYFIDQTRQLVDANLKVMDEKWELEGKRM